MTDHDAYFAYLRDRRLTGKLYRQLLLYPRITRMLKGNCLDVGCGVGDLLAHRPRSVGVDINQRNVEYCRSRGLEAHVMQEGTLPMASATFDSVLLDNVIEHVPDPAPLMLEIKRVLMHDGLFVVGIPGLRGWHGDPDHKVYYDEPILRTFVESFGFRLQRVIHTPLWRWRWLDHTLRQYSIYLQFTQAP